MRFTKACLVLLTLVVAAPFAVSMARAGERESKTQGEQWRFTRHNGEWWYWLPSNRWVYWRDGRWNDYDLHTYRWPDSAKPTANKTVGARKSNQTIDESDNRPFYGHSLSNWDTRNLQNDSETGPFYGRAMPSEILGPWRARRASRPYYGHAVSAPEN